MPNNEPNNVTKLVYTNRNITKIGNNSFENFYSLESIRLFAGLKEIGNYSFKNCSKLTGIIIPDTVKKIGKGAFLNCTNLLSIKIPKTIKKINKIAFKNCPKLTIYCEKNSFADKYAHKYGIKVQYMPL